MNRNEVLERMCKLSTKVMIDMFDASVPADCICIDNARQKQYFQFSEKVMSFIEDAVNSKLEAAEGAVNNEEG